MSLEYMKQIAKAEEEADEIRKTAAADAKAAIDAGRREAQVLKDNAAREARAAYEAVIAEAEEKAANAYDQKLAEVAKECEAMKAEARKNMDAAVDIIIGKVVDTSGDR